jgi:phasin family protein
MTTFTAEQFLTNTKAAAAAYGELATTAFARFEKLTELNLSVGKSALAESLNGIQEILGAKTPQEALAIQAALVQPLAQNVASYGRTVYELASETGIELSKLVEGKFAEGRKAFASFIDSLAKNAPAGSVTAFASYTNALATGEQLIESVQASAKQAVAEAETSLVDVTDVAVKPVKKK